MCDYDGGNKRKVCSKIDDDSWKDMIRRWAFTVKNYRWKHLILGLKKVVTKNIADDHFWGKRRVGIT